MCWGLRSGELTLNVEEAAGGVWCGVHGGGTRRGGAGGAVLYHVAHDGTVVSKR